MRSILLSAFLLFCLNSCNPIYVPAPPAAPLLGKAGDVALTFNGSPLVMINGNIAYAILDNLSVMAEMTNDPSLEHSAELRYWSSNVALGYNHARKNGWRAEVFVGGGLGIGENTGSGSLLGSSNRKRARFRNMLGQAALGYVGDNFESIYQLRAVHLWFDRFEVITPHYGSGDAVTEMRVTRGPEQFSVFEHTYLLRLGSENFKFQWFINVSTGTEGHHAAVNLGCGLHIRMNLIEWLTPQTSPSPSQQ